MSSLAAQLAQNTSLNAALLVDRSRRKPTASYLFTGKDADQHDLEAIHALGVNSLLHLISVIPALEKYEDILFSERAKETDRTLLSSEAIEKLDGAIEEFLWLLSPYLMEAPTGKIIEWLVRRFRCVIPLFKMRRNSWEDFLESTSLMLEPCYPCSSHITKRLILPRW